MRSRGDGAPRRRRDRWPWLSVVPFGFGAWAPIVAGVRRRVWWWIGLGLLWTGCVVVAFAIAAAHSGHESRQQRSLIGLLIIVGWVGSMVTSFAIRGAYERRGGSVRRERFWPVPTERSRAWTARYALIAYVATFVGANALALLLRDVAGIKFHVGVGVLVIDAGLLAGLLPLRRRMGMSFADLGLRPTLGMPALGLTVLALFAYAAAVTLWIVVFVSHSTAGTLSGNPAHLSTVNIVIAAVAISASAPIVEEIFFRGLLYRSLRNRLSVLPAALLAGALFGLVHITSYPLITLPVKAAFGVVACLLYERTGSLLPGIALHAFIDASFVDVALTGNNAIVLICAGALAVLVSATALVRVLRTRGNPSAATAPTAGSSDVGDPVGEGDGMIA